MEAHEAMERAERIHGGGHTREGMASVAAIVVAVLAAFLAISSFLSNEQVKDVVTGATKGATLDTRLETNEVKATLAENDAVLLRTVGTGNPRAVAHAARLEARTAAELAPRDAQLRAQIVADTNAQNRSDQKHTLYEISQVGLQVGIVLAGIAILVRRRWLLGFGGLMGLAGMGVMFAGIAY